VYITMITRRGKSNGGALSRSIEETREKSKGELGLEAVAVIRCVNFRLWVTHDR